MQHASDTSTADLSMSDMGGMIPRATGAARESDLRSLAKPVRRIRDLEAFLPDLIVCIQICPPTVRSVVAAVVLRSA